MEVYPIFGILPVSYTHLVFFFSWRIYLAVPAPQPDIENNTELAYEQNSSEEGNIPPTVTASPTTTAGFTLQNISNPVSYTHLDVYKRQM